MEGRLREDLDRTFATGAGRWSRAIMAVAWIHLAVFLGCQALHDPAIAERSPALALWAGS